MQFLRQSTAATVIMGPFVDNGDGVTPETGLAAGTVDEIGVYKHDATALTDISGTTTFTHRAGGMYTMTLSTDDTNTVGRMTAYVRDDSVCLPVWKDFMVLPAHIFDGFVLGTDYMQVDAVQISGDGTAADNLELLTENALGADNKILISTDAQDLSSTFDVNTKLIEGVDATNQIRDSILDDATRFSGANIDQALSTTESNIRGADSDTLKTLSDQIDAISVDNIWDEAMDVNAPAACNTAREYMNVIVAALAGMTAGTGDWSALSLGGNKTRIQATLSSSGARSSVDTVDGT